MRPSYSSAEKLLNIFVNAFDVTKLSSVCAVVLLSA